MKFKPIFPLHQSQSQLQTHPLADILQKCISKPPLLHLHLDQIHARSLVSGLSSDLFFTNLLLTAHSKSSRLADARYLFDRMPQRNLISWSSIISAHAHHNQLELSLSLFSLFHSSSPLTNPNEFVLASVLKACTHSKSPQRALQVHALALKTGYNSDLFVGTALIDFYSKLGSMESATLVFDSLPVKNSVTWTTLITSYSQAGRADMSLQMFDRMRNSGVEPDRFVISSLISACLALGSLEAGQQLHCFAYRRGTQMDVSVNNVLVDLYCKCSRIGAARSVFNSMGVKNLVSWTTMIAGYMQNSLHWAALNLFVEMGRSGWWPDAFACTSILSSCGSLMALEEGRGVHGYCIKGDLESDDFVKNGLIDMYCKCDTLADARLVFDAMESRNVISYNAMIEGYAAGGEVVEALTLFDRMRRYESLRPSVLTFVSLLNVSASLSLSCLCKQLHGVITKFGVSLDLYAGSALVNGYSRSLCVDDARLVFDGMYEKDLAVWNAMISGYVQNDQGEEALRLFLQLRLLGLRPDERTLVALVSVASNLASFFHGLQFHTQIIKSGVYDDPHVANALSDMYAKCGCIQEARVIFDSTCGRDVVCWNSMISRYAQHGHSEEALQVFDLMREENIEPNYITYVGVLSACGNVGLADKGLWHFNYMQRDFHIEPGIEHYASVVNLLGRAGRLEEAKEFIERMPIEPPPIVWRSLLSSCRVFGDVELGAYAAKMAISMEPDESGPYVLMSNIYASKGMWGDVEKLRRGMDSIGTGKEPGYSWIEVMKEVHVFIARGRDHKEIDSIYSLLDELTQLLKSVAYVPCDALF